jgi:myosin heavy subunit
MDYEKIKNNEQHEGTASALATYTDLFMSLSLIFLLMYVIASLRQGAGAIHGQIEKSRLQRENEDLKAQLKAYNALKDSSLQDQSEEEQKNYDKLMNKLSVLQEEAHDEKNQLRQKAMENERKEEALNQYQQIVRNMINSQMLAKNRLKTRENIIENKKEIIKNNEKTINQNQQTIAKNNQTIQNQKQDINNLNQEVDKQEQTIKQKQKQIAGLNNEIENKQSEINKNNQQMQNLNKELSNKISALKSAEKNHNITKSQMNKQIDNLKGQAQKQLSNLQAENQAAQSRLQAMNNELGATSQKLAGMKQQMEGMKGEMAGLQGQVQREAEAKSQLSKKLSDVEGQAREKEGQMGRKIAALSGDLQKAQEELNARKKLANDIASNLKKAGINADVNKDTGDVLISFGDDYFGAGSSQVNPSMQKVLEKFMPKYTESLFKDKNIAKKIGSVEIVGFASPTYAGKYVDPKSLKAEDRKAAKFNLDLSYKRARAIFEHVFDTGKMNFKDQEKLLPLVKVSGRSFFADGEKSANVTSGMPQKDFCKKYDCQKSQKVIIKFNLEDKKE